MSPGCRAQSFREHNFKVFLVLPDKSWFRFLDLYKFIYLNSPTHLQSRKTLGPIYFLAKVIFMACEGVILNPCRASLAALLCSSVANSTNAISCLFGTRRTSLNPGNWLKSIDNIISLVSSGRLVKNRIWFGGCSAVELFGLSAFEAFFFLSLQL